MFRRFLLVTSCRVKRLTTLVPFSDRLFMGAEQDDVRGIGFVAPSVTPLMFEGGVNPSVRIYDYDPENRVIIDYETVRNTWYKI